MNKEITVLEMLADYARIDLGKERFLLMGPKHYEQYRSETTGEDYINVETHGFGASVILHYLGITWAIIQTKDEMFLQLRSI